MRQVCELIQIRLLRTVIRTLEFHSLWMVCIVNFLINLIKLYSSILIFSGVELFYFNEETGTLLIRCELDYLLPDHQQIVVEHLSREDRRLETFNQGWRNDNVAPFDLARAGFFYFGSLDHVQCVFCRRIICRWEEGDDVIAEHHRLSPSCEFIRNFFPSNVNTRENSSSSLPSAPPLPSSHNVSSGERISQNQQDPVTNRRFVLQQIPIPLPYHPHESKISSDDSCTIRTQLPFYTVASHLRAKFLYYHARRSTFDKWPKGVGLDAYAMASAGFFYTMVSDQVACPFCSIHLRSWSSHHKPLVEHARWNPNCEFIRGLSKWNLDRRNRDSSLTVCGVSSVQVESAREDIADDEMSDAAELTSKDLNIRGSETTLDRIRNHIGTQKEEHQNSVSCVLCLEEKSNTLFLPCGHFCTCASCADSLQQTSCPICREGIKSVVRVYF